MKIKKYNAKSRMVHKIALKQQLRKAHKELEEESKKYPQQALYTNSTLSAVNSADSSSDEIENKEANIIPEKYNNSYAKEKKDPFYEAKKKYQKLQEELEVVQKEKQLQKQQRERLLEVQRKKRLDKSKIFLLKNKKGQPKLSHQIGAMLSKLEKK